MNILYLSPSYIPSRRANGIQVMKMCDAFARAGHDVTLISKQNAAKQEPGVDDDYEFYGVEPTFRILKVPRPSWRGGAIIYAAALARRLWRARMTIDLIYARDVVGASLATQVGLPTVFETHEFPQHWAGRRVHRFLLGSAFLRRLVTNCRVLRDDFAATGWVRTADMVVAYLGSESLNGVAPLRTEFAGGRPQLGYVGHLYRGKGMEMIGGIGARMPECDVHVVGGAERDLAAWRGAGLPANVVLHGFVPPADLPDYYGRCDIMLLPVQREVYGGSGRMNIGRWTTPLKMFEYMAAGRPIVASDLPVFREVLEHGRNALLVSPHDLDAWVTAVQSLIADAPRRLALAASARQDFDREYTQEARARRVLAGLAVSP